MKFRCEKDVLDRAFSIARRATPSKNPPLPVLSGLYLLLKKNQLTVIGSDLDLTARIQIKVNGEKDGEFVVPPLASEIVHSIDEGVVNVDIEDGEAQFSLGRSNFGIRTLPINDFPKFEEPGSDPVNLNINDFMTALEQVVKAASNDEARQILELKGGDQVAF